MRAAIYTRVSTTEQAENGHGLQAQELDARRYCGQRGLDVVDVYTEAGVSGTKTSRPEFDRLMSDAQAGAFDVLVVPALDRLGRSLLMILNTVQELGELGVGFVAVREGLDGTGPSGKLMLQMFGALAEFERNLIAERTRTALAAKRAKGQDAGGRLPYGYRRILNAETGRSEGIEVAPEQAATVRRIFREVDAGASMLGTAKALNADGVTTAGGGQFYASTVRVILGNRDRYEGANCVPPILT